jgi:DNA-binding NarL/FixJ family response regulator
MRSGPEALTPAERRVAVLAAEGMANRAIAERLVVAQRTVEFHLSSTYRKLGVGGRRELLDALTPP